MHRSQLSVRTSVGLESGSSTSSYQYGNSSASAMASRWRGRVDRRRRSPLVMSCPTRARVRGAARRAGPIGWRPWRAPVLRCRHGSRASREGGPRSPRRRPGSAWRRPRRWPPRASTVAICGRDRARIEDGGGRGRPRLRAARVRRGRRRGRRRRSSPRPPRRSAASTSSSPTPAARRRATSRRRTSTPIRRRIDLNLMSVVGDVKAAVAGDAGRAGGGGSWRSRRSRCASRWPNLILSNTARAGATGFLKTARPRGRRRRGDGQLGAARPAPHRPGDAALRRRRPTTMRHGRRRRLRRHRRVPVQRAGEVPHRRPDPRRRRQPTRRCSEPVPPRLLARSSPTER